MKKKLGIILGVMAGLAIICIVIFAGIKVSTDAGKNESVVASEELANTGNVIDLSEYSGKNVAIKTGGQYILTGDMTGSLVIDSQEDVFLLLNGVNITNYTTASIINLNDIKLTIGLIQETENSFFGGSNKKYNSVIWSKGEVGISGDKGQIVLTTRLASNTPIFSEKSVNLNSGVVIFTTKNELDNSNINTSLAKLEINSKKEFKAGDAVVIVDGVQDELAQFEAKGDFSKIYMFANFLEKGKCFVYKNEELVASGEVK